MGGHVYFTQNRMANVACVICLYNEQAHELSRTLNSLLAMQPHIEGDEPIPHLGCRRWAGEDEHLNVQLPAAAFHATGDTL